jgi:predicted permease
MLHNLRSGFRSLINPGERNAEIGDEVNSFFEQAVEHKMRQGLSRADAERAARGEIRSAEMVRHKVWAVGWETAVESFFKDLRYSLRQIMRSPGLSLVAILSLALGIGANTAIFTVIDNLLLKQLAVRDPRMLVSFGDGQDAGVMALSDPGPYTVFPYAFYRRIEGNRDELDGITAFASFATQVSVRSASTGNGPATQAIGHLVSGSYFSVLGVEPMMGRTLNPGDTATEGGDAVVVISHRYWRENLAGDPNAIGRTLAINGTTFVVVGVMPPSFFGGQLNEQGVDDMWLPITMQPQVMMQPSLLKPDGLFWVSMMGRRKPGLSVAQAQSWLTVEFQRFLTAREGAQISALRKQQIGGTYIPLLPAGAGISRMRRVYEDRLMVLMVMVGLVLLIACANLANLLLARAASREREFCARLALGSTRGRIARQILTEALVLALIGGGLGLGLALWATRVLIRFIDQGAKHSSLSATPDVSVLLFTLGTCVLTAALFGIAPALRASRTQAAGALNTSARTASGTAAGSRLLPKALIVFQVTLSLVLLTVAGLLMRTIENLRAEDLGINRTNILMVRTNPKFAGYAPERLNALYDRILARMDALPGVRSASVSGAAPLMRGNWGSPIDLDGRPTPPTEDISTLLNRVSAAYFETLEMQLLRGRTIAASDRANGVKAAVVNKTFADRYFPQGDAVGHTFTVADPGAPGAWHIVGVVRDPKHNSPAEKPAPFAWLAVTQVPGNDLYAYWIEVRSVGDPHKVAGEVRAALAELDASLPILETQTVEEQLDSIIDQERFVSKLSSVFAALALTLACIGLYGVMTYSVVRRTTELGVRMALGAPQASLRWMVLRESLVLLGIGVALGVPLSLAATRAIKAELFGVSPADPVTLLAAAVILSAALTAGAWIPARRATRADPMVALRYE